MAKKKIVDVGAPLYMGAYTALMTILLAFFIMLNSLTQTKKGGGHEGLGAIQNAFGVEGGFGLFQFTFWGKGGSHAPNPADAEKNEAGVHAGLTEGSGGTGDTEMDAKAAKIDKYIRAKLPVEFAPFSDKLTQKSMDELKRMGIGLALFNYKIFIRVYCGEYGEDSKDSMLALRRAAQIMRALNWTANVPYDNMRAAGYSSIRYFSSDKPDSKESTQETQSAYIYMFMKANNEKDK